MGTKIVRECTMTAVATKDLREATKFLVAQEEYRLESRMLAYKAVGDKVGASSMWVRRFVKGYGGAGINFAVGHKILEAYDKLCSRVEANNDHLRREIANAATETASTERHVEGDARYRTHSLLPWNEL